MIWLNAEHKLFKGKDLVYFVYNSAWHKRYSINTCKWMNDYSWTI